MVDEKLGRRQLETLGFSRELIDGVSARITASAFKRTLPPVALFPGRPQPEPPRDGGEQ
jgi:hypothetical protein